MRSFFCLVLLEGCRDDEEKESFQLKNIKAYCVRKAVLRKKAISQIFSIYVQYIAKFLTSMQFQFHLNSIGKGKAFLGLLFYYKRAGEAVQGLLLHS